MPDVTVIAVSLTPNILMVRPYLERDVEVKVDVRRACWPARMSPFSGGQDPSYECIQVHGGYGFIRQLTADGKTNHLESIWRDSKGEIYEGANEVQQWSIARVALGRDITG
jgi:hypothetical protein